MKLFKIAFQIIITLQVLNSQSRANEVGGVYIKNAGSDIMHLWVNGYYQGYVRPGETRYTVSDGFITNESDRPTDSGGRTAVEESHGGWKNNQSGPIELTFQYPGDKRQSNKFDVNGRKDLAVGVNESTATSSPQPPDELEIERAPAIIKGNLQNLFGVDQEMSSEGRSVSSMKEGWNELVGDWSGGTLGQNGGNMRLIVAADGTWKMYGPSNFEASGRNMAMELEAVSWEDAFSGLDFSGPNPQPQYLLELIFSEFEVDTTDSLPQLYKMTGGFEEDRLFFKDSNVIYYHHRLKSLNRLRPN